MDAEIYLSKQAIIIAKRLLSTGLWGTTIGEVCERLVYEKFREFVEIPKLRVKP